MCLTPIPIITQPLGDYWQPAVLLCSCGFVPSNIQKMNPVSQSYTTPVPGTCYLIPGRLQCPDMPLPSDPYSAFRMLSAQVFKRHSSRFQLFSFLAHYWCNELPLLSGWANQCASPDRDLKQTYSGHTLANHWLTYLNLDQTYLLYRLWHGHQCTSDSHNFSSLQCCRWPSVVNSSSVTLRIQLKCFAFFPPHQLYHDFLLSRSWFNYVSSQKN